MFDYANVSQSQPVTIRVARESIALCKTAARGDKKPMIKHDKLDTVVSARDHRSRL
jgi:hypothetical protein